MKYFYYCVRFKRNAAIEDSGIRSSDRGRIKKCALGPEYCNEVMFPEWNDFGSDGELVASLELPRLFSRPQQNYDMVLRFSIVDRFLTFQERS